MTATQLTRRRGGSPFLVDLDIDDPPVAAARKALARGNPDPAEQLLRQTTEPNQRVYVCEALADWPGEPAFLTQWATTRPSPDTAIITAIQRTKWAWEARGGGAGSSVGASAFQTFTTRLDEVKTRLLAAAKQSPRDASMMPWLMWCARGLGDPQLSDKAFAEAVKRQPTMRAAYSSALLTHSNKWFGSRDKMFSFAREHAASAPRESGAAVLVIEAHQYVFEAFALSNERRKTYWLDPSNKMEVTGANEAAKLSGLHGMNGIRNRHWLAYGLWRAGERAAAAEHFAHLGNTWNQWPWGGYRTGFNWLLNSFGRARKQCRA